MIAQFVCYEIWHLYESICSICKYLRNNYEMKSHLLTAQPKKLNVKNPNLLSTRVFSPPLQSWLLFQDWACCPFVLTDVCVCIQCGLVLMQLSDLDICKSILYWFSWSNLCLLFGEINWCRYVWICLVIVIELSII